uniref:Protein kinase domain-containing protein n=1 Tax=Rhizophagus irregularis (strain DAOM 181602 / DAOM 197198 / MUCL 43194) TaxID=747089 RepID=U9THV9_RHIID
MLINSEDLDHIYKILKAGKYVYQIYGISKDPTSHIYILVFDDEGYNQNLCIKCQILSSFFDWCKSCKLDNFQLNYGEFPSENDEIDKILKDNYCKSRSSEEFIEWIPYDEFKDIIHIAYHEEIYSADWPKGCIRSWDKDKFNWSREVKRVILVNFKYNVNDFDKDIDVILKGNYCKSNKMSEFIEWIPYSSFIDISYINQGGFSKVYSALWLNNNIYEWDQIELEWKRLSGYKKVVLKVLESSCYNISGFLQEVQSYCKIGFSHKITKLYGISKEPNTQNYVLVLEYINHGSLRGFLDKYNKYLITTYKIRILKNIAEGIKEIHSKNIIHQDIHSENILTKDFDRAKITDLGLSKFVSRDEKKENVYKVYGNLPYIAPEVLRGKRYTQNADIYAFGIIINEVFTGERPFHDVIDDNLMLDICKNGLRPKIGKNTPKSLVHLLNKCWDATPSNRPTVDEIIQKLNHFETDDIIFEELRNYNNGVIKQYFELTSKSDHLKTSNSSKLHSINPSNFTGVLYCCISNENEEIGSASTSRNNYQVTNLSSETDDSSECDNCIIKLNLSGNYT